MRNTPKPPKKRRLRRRNLPWTAGDDVASHPVVHLACEQRPRRLHLQTDVRDFVVTQGAHRGPRRPPPPGHPRHRRPSPDSPPFPVFPVFRIVPPYVSLRTPLLPPAASTSLSCPPPTVFPRRDPAPSLPLLALAERLPRGGRPPRTDTYIPDSPPIPATLPPPDSCPQKQHSSTQALRSETQASPCTPVSPRLPGAPWLLALQVLEALVLSPGPWGHPPNGHPAAGTVVLRHGWRSNTPTEAWAPGEHTLPQGALAPAPAGLEP